MLSGHATAASNIPNRPPLRAGHEGNPPKADKRSGWAFFGSLSDICNFSVGDNALILFYETRKILFCHLGQVIKENG
jgi:hypothetical protein